MMGLRDSFKDKNWAGYNSNSNYVRLKPGIHLIQIKYVFEYETYLELFVDIVTASNQEKLMFDEMKNYFSKTAKKKAEEEGREIYECWDRAAKIRLYFASTQSSEKDEAAKNVFKARITAIEESNAGYSLESANFDSATLIGKVAIGVWGAEEYVKRDGTVGESVSLHTLRSVGAFLNGEVEIPKKRTLKDSNQGVTTTTFRAPSDKPSAPKAPSMTSYGQVSSSLPPEGDDDVDLPF